MSTFRTISKNGRLVMYGFDEPYAGYFITVWETNSDEEDPIIEEDRWSGMTGNKLVEMLEGKLGVSLPKHHREQALDDLPFEDIEDEELQF
jgi:hypothetical protein